MRKRRRKRWNSRQSPTPTISGKGTRRRSAGPRICPGWDSLGSASPAPASRLGPLLCLSYMEETRAVSRFVSRGAGSVTPGRRPAPAHVSRCAVEACQGALARPVSLVGLTAPRYLGYSPPPATPPIRTLGLHYASFYRLLSRSRQARPALPSWVPPLSCGVRCSCKRGCIVEGLAQICATDSA
ncbi:unnamed protein product [Amoebophrya sp. A120]|nr:unnamed protein product [Amoebophrya sp. A120]CAD7970058.1 unnamed protein product [Amoebophrya sp. A120]|eukprot:GSA120T00022101001.1